MEILWKYRALFARYWVSLAFGVLMLVVTRLLAVRIPLLVKTSVDTLEAMGQAANLAPALVASNQTTLHTALLTIAAMAVGMLVARIFSRKYLLSVGKRIEFDLRNQLYAHLLKMPASFFQSHPTGELMSRMTSDVDATRFIPGGGVMLGVNTFLAYVFTIPMMYMLSPQLTLVSFIIYPIAIFIMTRLSGRVKSGYHAVQEDLAEISTTAQENLSGMAVIQAYAKEPSESARFQRLCDAYLGSYQGLVRQRLLLFVLLAALSGFSMLIILWVGGIEIIGGTFELGGFIAFTLYLEQLAWPTMALGWTISVFQQGAASLERIETVLSESPAFHAEYSEQQASFVAQTKGRLEIRHLSFSYENPYAASAEAARHPGNADAEKPSLNDTGPNQADRAQKPTQQAQPAGAPETAPLGEHPPTAPRKKVLREVSLVIQPGETVAIVGPVGAGKSTLLRMLPRIEDVPAGTVFLDGQDITTLNPADLRAVMVFMPQVSFLFSHSVSQNIAFGRPQAVHNPMEEIIPIATAAGVHQDVLGFPQQYETLVGERGIMLSGGQRQRVALARALMLEAPILVLDDPFSNVDAETEQRIIAALGERQLFEDRTTVFATHRFSLVRQADRVVLMEAGEIVAIGTHEDLLNTQPLYQKLNRLEALRHEFESAPESPGTFGKMTGASDTFGEAIS